MSEPPHIPVMLDEVMSALAPSANDVVVDATFGAGGYSRAIVEKGARVVAIDRDPDAVAAARRWIDESHGLLTVDQGRFSTLDTIARLHGFEQVDGIVADIGVSSMQIDQADRGFSFQKDGPLDMRMEQSGVSAADVVNTFDRPDLTRIIGILGEERQASRISAEIVARRKVHPFETTRDLASTVEKVLGRRQGDRIHPATRTFQALRIYVNGELDELANACLAAERILKPGGRFVVVTFHSLEDRLVKKFLADRSGSTSGSRHLPETVADAPTFQPITRGAVKASHVEAQDNARARSAKLRAALRTDAPARDTGRSVFGLPNLAPLERNTRGKPA